MTAVAGEDVTENIADGPVRAFEVLGRAGAVFLEVRGEVYMSRREL